MCDMYKMRDGMVEFTEINDKVECVNHDTVTAVNKKLKPHKAEKWGE